MAPLFPVGPARDEVLRDRKEVLDLVQRTAMDKFEVNRLQLEKADAIRDAEALGRQLAAQCAAEQARERVQREIENRRYFTRQLPVSDITHGRAHYIKESEEVVLDGKRRCGARTKKGKICTQIIPYGRCRWHNRA